MNKGRFFITVLASSAVLFSVASTPAFANSQGKYHERSNLTVVRGNVYDESKGGKGIGGLHVAVSCVSDKNRTISRNAVTDRNGLYTVRYNEERCEAHQPVFATVTYNGQTQTDNVYVSQQNTATMDFYFGSVSVPEFGFIPGAIAAVASVGTFLTLKKRKN